MKVRQKIRNWIKSQFNLYDIKDLQIGGHCGLCGTWIPDIIVSKNDPKMFRVGICKDCKN